MLKFIGYATLAFVTQFLSLGASTDLPEKENFHLFLLAGQSNMAGRGIIGEEDKVLHPRILMLTQDGTWAPAKHPIHFDKSVAGVGLSMSFAEVLTETDEDIFIGLIPAACGGSSITTWEPGGYHTQTKSHPYDDAMDRAHIAMRDGILKGILWHQGESDSKPGLSEFYEMRLRSLITRFREDLGHPILPFVIGQLGQFEQKPWTHHRIIVNHAHELIATDTPYVSFVSSNGLTPNDDIVHFDSPSLKKFGHRYAKAYLKLISENE
jgi:hypothetical protein